MKVILSLSIACTFLLGCPPSAAPSPPQQGALQERDAGPGPAGGVDAGSGEDANRPKFVNADMGSIRCPPPSKSGGFRVCGQSLKTWLGKDGELLGLAASTDGMTVFGIDKMPRSRADIVTLGSAGTGAVLVQTTTNEADGTFDVQLSRKPKAAVLCPTRLLATEERCAVIDPTNASAVVVLLVENGALLTWASLPETALRAMPIAPSNGP